MKTVILFALTLTFSELAFADCVDALKPKKDSLFRAIAMRDIDELKLALKQGADINFRDNYTTEINSEYKNTTALMLAIATELTDFVEALVEVASKKDLDAKDSDGNTALMYAAVVGNIKIINVLLEAGADKNATNNENKSAHFIALENMEQSDIDNYSDRLKVLDLLSSNGNLGY